jgi:hypothetical protein
MGEVQMSSLTGLAGATTNPFSSEKTGLSGGKPACPEESGAPRGTYPPGLVVAVGGSAIGVGVAVGGSIVGVGVSVGGGTVGVQVGVGSDGVAVGTLVQVGVGVGGDAGK